MGLAAPVKSCESKIHIHYNKNMYYKILHETSNFSQVIISTFCSNARISRQWADVQVWARSTRRWAARFLTSKSGSFSMCCKCGKTTISMSSSWKKNIDNSNASSLTHCGLGMPYGNGSGNGMMPDSIKPFPEPIMTWDYWHPCRCNVIENAQDMLTKIII